MNSKYLSNYFKHRIKKCFINNIHPLLKEINPDLDETINNQYYKSFPTKY